MGLGGALKKVGKVALKAAPFAAMAVPGLQGLGLMGATGMAGKLGSILGTAGDIAGKISPVLGKAADSRATALRAEGQDQMQRDQLNQNAALGNRDLPNRRMGTAGRAAAIMAGPVGVNMIRPGEGMQGKTTQFTGGMNTAMSDPRFRELADRTMDATLHSQLTGDDRVPGATPAPKSGFIDKALGAGSFASGLLGAIGPLLNRKPPARPSGVMMPQSGSILRQPTFGNNPFGGDQQPILNTRPRVVF